MPPDSLLHRRDPGGYTVAVTPAREEFPMPSLLRQNACPACGHAHNFGSPTGRVTAGDVLEYVCPETGRHSTLRAVEDGQGVHTLPQGAVVLEAARERAAA